MDRSSSDRWGRSNSSLQPPLGYSPPRGHKTSGGLFLVPPLWQAWIAIFVWPVTWESYIFVWFLVLMAFYFLVYWHPFQNLSSVLISNCLKRTRYRQNIRLTPFCFPLSRDFDPQVFVDLVAQSHFLLLHSEAATTSNSWFLA